LCCFISGGCPAVLEALCVAGRFFRRRGGGLAGVVAGTRRISISPRVIALVFKAVIIPVALGRIVRRLGNSPDDRDGDRA